MYGQALITKKPQAGSVQDKEYVPAFWQHVERFKLRAAGAFLDNADKQTERLAHPNALRALTLQVTPPTMRNATGIRIPWTAITGTGPASIAKVAPAARTASLRRILGRAPR